MKRNSLRLVILGVAIGVASLSTPVQAADPAPTPLARLQAGNARFVADAPQPAPLGAPRRQELAKGQHPFAIVLSCADSRVPPEHVFNVGLGDLFVVRTAGEVTDRAVLASVEYAAEHLGASLLVVMGHEACGAVKAAAESHGASLGPNLDYLVQAIAPAVKRTKGEQDQIRAAIFANVEQVINDVLAKSAILRERAEKGELQMVGAYYELASGKVSFSQPVAATALTVAEHGRK